VATPHYQHAEQIEAAAPSGKHVLCGKLIAATVAEADLLSWFLGQEAHSVTTEINVTIEGNVGVTDFIRFSVRFGDSSIGSARC
jgi:predicted dehydrogenase